MNNELQQRKRAGLRRRLQQVRDAYELPALSNRERERLLTALMNVRGDMPTDSALRTLHSLTTRGLFDEN